MATKQASLTEESIGELIRQLGKADHGTGMYIPNLTRRVYPGLKEHDILAKCKEVREFLETLVGGPRTVFVDKKACSKYIVKNKKSGAYSLRYVRTREVPKP
jgi:hypothetical protein